VQSAVHLGEPIDNERDAPKRAKLLGRLGLVRKALMVTVKPLGAMAESGAQNDVADLFFALQLFCAFGLFANKPTTADLVRYFAGTEAPAAVDAALAALVGLGLVRRIDERWGLLSEQIVFSEDEKGFSHLDLLKRGLAHAAAHVEEWFPRKTSSHFESSIISVRRERFQKLLPEMKSRLLLARSDLEAGDADMLISFNVQIYPLVQRELPGAGPGRRPSQRGDG
jgi:hypothetical protein